MAKQQRIIFAISETTDGRMKIDMKMYPKVSRNQEEFDKLSFRERAMQSSASHIVKFVMQAMMKLEKEKENGL